MRMLVLTWFCACALVLSAIVLSQTGCVFDSEGVGSRHGEIGQTTFEDFPRRAADGFSVRLAAHAEEYNLPHLVVAEQYVCFAAYDVVNAGNAPRSVRRVRFAVFPSKAFSSARAHWADQPSAVGAAGEVDAHGGVTVTLPGAGDVVKPHAVRTLHLCGVTRALATTASRVTAQSASGERVLITLQSIEDSQGFAARNEEPLGGAEHVVRKTVPHVSIGEQTISPITPGLQLLFAWNVGADPQGRLAIKQFGLHLELEKVEVCDLQLRRNGTPVSPDVVDIRAVSETRRVSTSLLSSCFETTMDLAILFHHEQALLPGQDVFFALRGKIRRVNQGARLTASFLRTPELVTTSLGCTTQQFVVTTSDPSYLPGLLWSDYSDEPHSHVICHSSRDWIGDALVQSLGAPWRFSAAS